MILLPVFIPQLTLTERLKAVRSAPVQQIESAVRVSREVERRVRRTISEFEAKLLRKYCVEEPFFDQRVVEKPCDS